MRPVLRKCAFCLLVSLVLSGCSGGPGTDYSQVELLNVSGIVTLDGEPLPNAVVTFVNPETDTFSYGLTDRSGQYSLQFDIVRSGCTPGAKRVEISTTRSILGLNSAEEGAAPDGEESGEGAEPAPKIQELVPLRYNQKSELTVEVSASSRTHDFALNSK